MDSSHCPVLLGNMFNDNIKLGHRRPAIEKWHACDAVRKIWLPLVYTQNNRLSLCIMLILFHLFIGLHCLLVDLRNKIVQHEYIKGHLLALCADRAIVD